MEENNMDIDNATTTDYGAFAISTVSGYKNNRPFYMGLFPAEKEILDQYISAIRAMEKVPFYDEWCEILLANFTASWIEGPSRIERAKLEAIEAEKEARYYKGKAVNQSGGPPKLRRITLGR